MSSTARCRSCNGLMLEYAIEGCTNQAHPLDPALEATCEHGLSAWLCEGPGHYPADTNEPPATVSEAAAQYHRQGMSCPFDCAACDSANVEDEPVEEPPPFEVVTIYGVIPASTYPLAKAHALRAASETGRAATVRRRQEV